MLATRSARAVFSQLAWSLPSFRFLSRCRLD